MPTLRTCETQTHTATLIPMGTHIHMKQSLEEVASWCSLHELIATHEDSPEQARRRRMISEASSLLRAAYKGGWHNKLSETREWSKAMALLKESDPDSLAPLEHQLRTIALKPSVSIGDPFCSETELEEAVIGVVERRSTLLKSRLSTDYMKLGTALSGRLLRYEPRENVSDCASRYASNGFFDPNDAPPWDTWVGYSDGTLTSWVPDPLVPLAQAGIDANAVDCIGWKT